MSARKSHKVAENKDGLSRIVDFITGNMMIFAMLLFGGFAPGCLTIGLFSRSLLETLDFFKLLFLSYAISAPVVSMYFMVLSVYIFRDKTIYDIGKQGLIFSLVLTDITFSTGLLLKIFIKDLNLQGFVLILIAMSVVFSIFAAVYHPLGKMIQAMVRWAGKMLKKTTIKLSIAVKKIRNDTKQKRERDA